MYFDAVVFKSDGDVAFSGEPEEVRQWLGHRPEWMRHHLLVLQGETLLEFEVEEYLKYFHSQDLHG